MGSAVVLSGSIVAGPTSASDCGFPSGVVNLQFGLTPAQFAVAAQAHRVRDLNSPSSFAALDGVGSGEAVTKATFLFLRTNAPVQVRMTFQPASGPDVVSIVYVYGPMLIEAPSSNYIKLLEAQGVGKVEYFAGGTE